MPEIAKLDNIIIINVDEEDATGDRWKVTRPQNAFNRPRTLRRLTSDKAPGHERILRIYRGQQR